MFYPSLSIRLNVHLCVLQHWGRTHSVYCVFLFLEFMCKIQQNGVNHQKHFCHSSDLKQQIRDQNLSDCERSVCHCGCHKITTIFISQWSPYTSCPGFILTPLISSRSVHSSHVEHHIIKPLFIYRYSLMCDVIYQLWWILIICEVNKQPLSVRRWMNAPFQLHPASHSCLQWSIKPWWVLPPNTASFLHNTHTQGLLFVQLMTRVGLNTSHRAAGE